MAEIIQIDMFDTDGVKIVVNDSDDVIKDDDDVAVDIKKCLVDLLMIQVTEMYGQKCIDYHPNCVVCYAWKVFKEFDDANKLSIVKA